VARDRLEPLQGRVADCSHAEPDDHDSLTTHDPRLRSCEADPLTQPVWCRVMRAGRGRGKTTRPAPGDSRAT
jgi:hypothetical protein